MEMRQLGKDGPEVSRICFGCFSMGGAGVWGWADINDEDSIAAVHKALDAGITFFDNAALYGLGHAEELLGKQLGKSVKMSWWRRNAGFIFLDKAALNGWGHAEELLGKHWETGVRMSWWRRNVGIGGKPCGSPS